MAILEMKKHPPNQPDPVNPAISSRLHSGSHCRAVTDPER